MTTDDRLRALEDRFDSFIAAQSEVTAELRAMRKIHDQRSKDHEQWMRGLGEMMIEHKQMMTEHKEWITEMRRERG